MRYDRDLSDIFALQSEISETIVAALKVKLLPEEKKAIESRSTYDPDAYQLYLLGRDYQLRHSARSLGIALRFYQQALEIDPHYARAWAMVAVCQARLHWIGKAEDSGLTAAEKALALDTSLAEAHAARGRVLAQRHQIGVLLDPVDEFGRHLRYARLQQIEGLIRLVHLNQGAAKVVVVHGIVRLDGLGAQRPLLGPFILSQSRQGDDAAYERIGIVRTRRDLPLDALHGATGDRNAVLIPAKRNIAHGRKAQ